MASFRPRRSLLLCMVGGSSSSDEAVCIDWITYSDVQEVMEITTGGVFVVF